MKRTWARWKYVHTYVCIHYLLIWNAHTRTDNYIHTCMYACNIHIGFVCTWMYNTSLDEFSSTLSTASAPLRHPLAERYSTLFNIHTYVCMYGADTKLINTDIVNHQFSHIFVCLSAYIETYLCFFSLSLCAFWTRFTFM